LIEGAKLIEGLSKALVLIPGVLHYGQAGVVLLDLLPGEFPGPRNVGKDVRLGPVSSTHLPRQSHCTDTWLAL